MAIPSAEASVAAIASMMNRGQPVPDSLILEFKVVLIMLSHLTQARITERYLLWCSLAKFLWSSGNCYR
jgi:hypothetical protein